MLLQNSELDSMQYLSVRAGLLTIRALFGPQAPKVAWRHSVGCTEQAAEVRQVGETPAFGDGLDGAGVQSGVGQVETAAFQTAVAYPGRRGRVVLGEQLLEMRQGDVVSVRDRLGIHVRVSELLYENACLSLFLLCTSPTGVASARSQLLPSQVLSSYRPYALLPWTSLLRGCVSSRGRLAASPARRARLTLGTAAPLSGSSAVHAFDSVLTEL